MNGGQLIANVLKAQGVKQVFTLCGGHISPILVEAMKELIAKNEALEARIAVLEGS